MNFPSREAVRRLKDTYQQGMRVELISMEDFQAPPIGTRGIIRGVDDAGNIMVNWDTGSRLSLVYGEDEFKVIREEKKFKPNCKLLGEDGNIFNLIGIATKTLKAQGFENEAQLLYKRIVTDEEPANYSEALMIIADYVVIE